MAISRSEMQEYFENFGIMVDSDGSRLPCYICGVDLKYTYSLFNSGYSCTNGHHYTYHEMVMEHASFLAQCPLQRN